MSTGERLDRLAEAATWMTSEDFDWLIGEARRVPQLEAELAAYKRAKSENDERFMTERDEARAALQRVRELAQEADDAKRDVDVAELVAAVGVDSPPTDQPATDEDEFDPLDLLSCCAGPHDYGTTCLAPGSLLDRYGPAAAPVGDQPTEQAKP